MKRESKVEIQKGKIISNPPTMKQMTYPERVTEREKEYKDIRRGQNTDLHTPRKGRA
jgi:hypothetical protein